MTSAGRASFVVIQTHLSFGFLIGCKTIKGFTSMRPPVAAAAPRPAAGCRLIQRPGDAFGCHAFERNPRESGVLMMEKPAIFGAGWTGHMKNDLSVHRLV
jgi:hypothetical protein